MAYFVVLCILVVTNFLSIGRLSADNPGRKWLYSIPLTLITGGILVGALLFSYSGDNLSRNYAKMVFVILFFGLYFIQWLVLGVWSLFRK